MRPTVKDVASLARVSPKTVSNVINGVVFVRPETRERVEQAIAELGFVPNLSARGLRNGRSGVIALAMPDLSTPYSAEMSHNFVEVAHEQGWVIQFEETAREPDRAWELVSRARAHLVDGLILNPLTLTETDVAVGASVPPLVLIGDVQQQVADQVWVDSIAAARDMTQYLLGLGHRRIATVGHNAPPHETSTARLRLQGHREALAAAGIAPDPRLNVPSPQWTPGSAAAAVTAFLAENEVPDAFFCFTDSVAIGTLNALWTAGIRVPEDTSVAGFDNVSDGEFATPPLTTVTFDKRDFAVQTLALLVSRIGNPGAETTLRTIPHAIVPRASTAAARPGR